MMNLRAYRMVGASRSDKMEMESKIIEALELFRLELPDPDRQLAKPALSEFTLFPQLAPEIRCKIWQMMFPRGRNVNIGIWYDYDGLRDEAHHPITLRVNRESRAETQRFYFAFYQLDPFVHIDLETISVEDEFGGVLSIEPARCIYIDPWKDLAELDYWHTSRRTVEYMIDFWRQKYPRCVDSIRRLRLNDVYLDPFPTYRGEVKPKKLDIDREARRHCWILRHFHGLEELTLSFKKFPQVYRSASDARTMKYIISEFFLKQKVSFPGCSIPKISIIRKGVLEE